jgi:hypothetical protein
MDDEYLVSSIDEIQAPRHGLYQFTQSIVTSIRGRDIFRADDSQMEARYQRLIESLFDAIQQMFAYFQIQGQDQLSLTIEGRLEDEQEIQIGIPRTLAANINVDSILNTITQKLNSAQTLQGQFRLVWVLYRSNQVQLLGNHPFRGNWDSFIASKTSFIQIHPPEDPYRDECFYQWIVMGLALWIQKHGLPSVLPPEISYVRFSKSSYSNLLKHPKKFEFRHQMVERLKQGFSNVEHRSQLSICERMEQILPIRFCIYGFSLETKSLTILYPPAEKLPYPDEKETIYGCAHGNQAQTFSHIDLVTNADDLDLFPSQVFTSKKCKRNGHVCRKCYQYYMTQLSCKHGNNEKHCENRNKQRKQHKQTETCPKCHICEGCCSSCLEPDCEPIEAIFCKDCKIYCHSNECYDRHRQLDFCKGFKKDSYYKHLQKLKDICPICRQDKHEGECFLQRSKLKKPSTRYAVYDFECCFDAQQKHIPYCVTCCFPYGHEEMNHLISKYPYRTVQSQIVFVFWGLHTEQFWDFLAEPCLQQTIFFAHNSRAYDVILIKSYLWNRKKWISQDICRGRKYLQVSYPKFDLTFRDSLCFIPTSLRSMSSDFGIDEYKKGHFPHKWMTLQHVEPILEQGIVEQRPGMEYFDFDFRSKKEREEAIEWITHFCTQKETWNLKEDAIEYCISDTLLLSETLKRFRQQTMEICATVERAEDVEMEEFDPFQYMTLASAMMAFYFSQCLPEETIGIIDRYKVLQIVHARAWILSLGKNYHPQEICSEIWIDAIEDQTVYRYYPCEEMGCTSCFPKLRQGQWHPRLQMTYEKVRQKRKKEEDILRLKGYHCITKWEHECDWATYDPLTIGIDPREAYKGGKTECYKLKVNQPCSMVDFVSQYPTVCFGESVDPLCLEEEKSLEWDLPIGHPTRMFHPEFYDWNQECLGIAKIHVLPPQNCYAPFLSYRSEGAYGELEVCYGCCKACMDNHQVEPCSHLDKERAFIGTWTLSEIRYALTIGYKILKIIEVWEYAEKSNQLFRSFIVPFMYNKIVAKTGGCVDNTRTSFTEKGKQVAQYLQHIMKREIHPQEFTDSPARRTVAKLIQNAFTGKWGQRDVFSLTRSFHAEESWSTFQILNDPNLIIQSAILLPDQCVTLTFEKQRGIALSGLRRKNDLIVAHITAYGRLMLSRVEQALQHRLVYVDTDSAYHIQNQNEQPIYRTGFRTGDLELECPHLWNWSALARKSYAYETKDKIVVKQKGIAMKPSLESFFAPQSLKSLIDSTKRKMEESDPVFHTVKKFKQIQPSIQVPQIQFKTEKIGLDVCKETVQSEKETRLNLFSCKRKIDWQSEIQTGILDTLPFGYRK